jgi:hypothetical protein
MSWSLSWLRLKNHPGNGTWYETCSVTTLSFQAGRAGFNLWLDLYPTS